MSFIEDGSVGIGTNTPIGILHLKRTAATTRMVMDGDAGQSKIITYRTAGLQRFGLYVNNTAESGSNAGSNFAIRAYSDAGTLLNTPLFIERSTGNVGVGTTTPTARLRVISADTNGIVDLFQNGSVASPLHLTRYGGNVPINLNASGGTSTSPTPLGDNAAMSRFSTNTYNGTAFGTSARIEVVSKGIQSATNYGSNMRFFVTAENATSTSEVLTLLSSGNVQINESIANDRGSKLFVKGSGSTSATTSLLVQNSSTVNLLQALDNGTITMGNATNSLTIEAGSNAIFHRTGINYFSNNSGTYYGTLQESGLQIGNGSAAPNASAIIDLTSTTKGFLPPRMTNAQRAAIGTPAVGLMVYCTDAVEGLYVYKSTGWTFVI
jgi:hypothetical protein